MGGDLVTDREGDLVLDLDLDLGDGDRRVGEGARWIEVGVCDLVLDRPREGDLETIWRCVWRYASSEGFRSSLNIGCLKTKRRENSVGCVCEG